MIVDTNVYLSRWPFRRLPGDETPTLVARLRQWNVSQAWAGSFDGILHKDIAGVNARLAEDCRKHGGGLLVPFGSVNPKLPDWREDLRRCAKDHRMPGIRLHPNYHGYDLKDPVFAELLQAAVEHNLIVQVAASMEDVRTQHPLVRVEPVDLAPLPGLVADRPGLRLILLNWRGAREARALADAGVCFDIATIEGVEGVGQLARRLPPERIVFGSSCPLFILEAAIMKVHESGLPEDQKAAILQGNAKRMLSQARPQ